MKTINFITKLNLRVIGFFTMFTVFTSAVVFSWIIYTKAENKKAALASAIALDPLPPLLVVNCEDNYGGHWLAFSADERARTCDHFAPLSDVQRI